MYSVYAEAQLLLALPTKLKGTLAYAFVLVQIKSNWW